MEPIQSIIASLAWDAILSEVHGRSQSLEMLKGQVLRVESKLDRLIGAPFRAAHLLLREGDLGACRRKLIEAISLDELDLPALAMYAWLLLVTDRESLAYEYFGLLVDRFGI